MEEAQLLDIDDERHIFCLHLIFLPKISESLRFFKEAWNGHPMTSEHNLSPQQQWVRGLALFHNCQAQQSLVSGSAHNINLVKGVRIGVLGWARWLQLHLFKSFWSGQPHAHSYKLDVRGPAGIMSNEDEV